MIPRLIDEIPILSLAACFAKGTTIIRDAEELRIKESDRIFAMQSELSRLGALVQETKDGLIITGGKLLKGSNHQTYSDHRIAMTMGIAGLLASGQTYVQDADAASISYPTFWEDLESLKVA